jgi:DNA-binding MarR family transcriptional regulator
MSRRRAKRAKRRRLVKAIPVVVVVVLGAVLREAIKRRASRGAIDDLRAGVAADSGGLAPAWSPPADSMPALAETDLGEVPRVDASSGDGDEKGPALSHTGETEVGDATSAQGPPTPTGDATSAPPAPPTARARGATTTNVLEALSKGGAMTAAEVAFATGLGRATTSSALSRLVRTGEVTKAERGYQLSAQMGSSAAGASSVGNAPAPAAPGATKAKVLAALSSDRGLTAGEVATATGLGRGTVSATLSRLAKRGEVLKSDRGYRLPG